MKDEETEIDIECSNLFRPSKTYKPFHYGWAVELCVDHEDVHWVESEAELSEDVRDWQLRLTPEEKQHITHILRLFTQSDVEVGRVYYDHLIPRFQNNEVRNMLGSFACREAIHQRAYALLNDTLGLPDSDYCAFLEYQEMADKVELMTSVDTTTMTGLKYTIVQAVLNEGVSLFASFAMLLSYQRYGKMKGMGTIVEWSLRDENMHVEGLTKLYETMTQEGHFRVRPEDHMVEGMAKQVVKLEDKFIDMAFELGDVEGLTAEETKNYIRFVTNVRLQALGYKAPFDVHENPLEWLDWVVGGKDHSNFFEKRVTEYSNTPLIGDWDWEKILGQKD